MFVQQKRKIICVVFWDVCFGPERPLRYHLLHMTTFGPNGEVFHAQCVTSHFSVYICFCGQTEVVCVWTPGVLTWFGKLRLLVISPSKKFLADKWLDIDVKLKFAVNTYFQGYMEEFCSTSIEWLVFRYNEC